MDPDTPQQEPQNHLDLLSGTPVPSHTLSLRGESPPHTHDASPGTQLSAPVTPAPRPPAHLRFPKKGNFLGTWNPSNLQTHIWDFPVYPNTAPACFGPELLPSTKDTPGPLHPGTFPSSHFLPLTLSARSTPSHYSLSLVYPRHVPSGILGLRTPLHLRIPLPSPLVIRKMPPLVPVPSFLWSQDPSPKPGFVSNQDTIL